MYTITHPVKLTTLNEEVKIEVRKHTFIDEAFQVCLYQGNVLKMEVAYVHESLLKHTTDALRQVGMTL